MPFREKSAWVMAGIIVLTAVLYAVMIAPLPGAVPPLPVVIGVIVVLAILSVLGQVAIAIFAPRDANAAADERDRRVADKAGNLSGIVLAVGVVLAMGTYLMGHGGNFMFHAVFISLIAAQFTEYALTIWFYRRGV